MNKQPKLYFAGPLFSEAEKTFNERLTRRIEAETDFLVFLPQRDGMEFGRLKEMKQIERTKAIFELDRDRVYESDTFLFILDGRVPDEGAALELGLAYAHKNISKKTKSRQLIGFMSDVRAWLPDQKLNPMLGGALERIFYVEEELIVYLKTL